MWQLTGHYLWHLTSNKNMQYAFSFHTFYRNILTSQSKQVPSSHDSRFGYIFNGKSQPRTKSETLNYQFCSSHWHTQGSTWKQSRTFVSSTDTCPACTNILAAVNVWIYHVHDAGYVYHYLQNWIYRYKQMATCRTESTDTSKWLLAELNLPIQANGNITSTKSKWPMGNMVIISMREINWQAAAATHLGRRDSGVGRQPGRRAAGRRSSTERGRACSDR